MKKSFYYIIAFLILTLSVGQKDIQYFLKEVFDSEYAVEIEKRKEKESENKEDGEEEKAEEEREGKRKKENFLSHFSGYKAQGFSKIKCCLKHRCFKLNSKTNHAQKIAAYITFCCLRFYS